MWLISEVKQRIKVRHEWSTQVNGLQASLLKIQPYVHVWRALLSGMKKAGPKLR